MFTTALFFSPLAIQCLPKASVQFTVPWSTMPMITSKALGLSRSVGLMKLPAALLISASQVPKRSMTAATSLSTSKWLRTSQATGSTAPPVAASSSLAVFCKVSNFLLVMQTFAPSRSSVSAMLRPRPVPPPVITIFIFGKRTFSSSLKSSFLS